MPLCMHTIITYKVAYITWKTKANKKNPTQINGFIWDKIYALKKSLIFGK